jgi:hypothetical protein
VFRLRMFRVRLRVLLMRIRVLRTIRRCLHMHRLSILRIRHVRLRFLLMLSSSASSSSYHASSCVSSRSSSCVSSPSCLPCVFFALFFVCMRVPCIIRRIRLCLIIILRLRVRLLHLLCPRLCCLLRFLFF